MIGPELNRTLLLFCILSLLLAPAMASGAQDRRTGIERMPPVDSGLETVARDLSDKAQDAWNVSQGPGGRSSVDLHMAIGGFAGAALAFSQAAAAGSDARALEGGARKLVVQAREIDGLLVREAGRVLEDRWMAVRMHLTRLSDIYRLGYTAGARSPSSGSDRGSPVPARPAGTFRWKGRVDGSDEIMLRENQVTIRHLINNPIKDTSYELPAPLPRQSMTLRLNKIRGRGKVEITEQPSVFNNYTVTVLVEDSQKGDELYEFELVW